MSTINLNDLMATIDSVQKQIYTSMVVPVGMTQEIRNSTANEINFKASHSRDPLVYGMKVFESSFAKLPAKRHKKRRWMAESYHRRIQKKWNKRWGYVPAAFMLNMNAISPNLFWRTP